MRYITFVCSLLIVPLAGCGSAAHVEAVRPAAAAAAAPVQTVTYQDACELVKQRRAKKDELWDMKMTLVNLNASDKEIEDVSKVYDVVALEYQKALTLQRSLEPKTGR